MRHVIETIITDFAEHDPTPLMGLIDHLRDKGYTSTRIALLAWRSFRIPPRVTFSTLELLQ